MSAANNQPCAKRTVLRYGQRGVALPLVIVGLLAILAIAGLSLDTSHALANKTRLQNAVDAAALAAAKEISMSEDTALATAAAMSLLGQNADGAGNHELNAAYDAGEINVIVQYSETVSPFTPGAPLGPNVRVIAQNFDIRTTLSKVLGIDEIPVMASAVAGPSPTIQPCDIAPIVVCADDMSAQYFGFEPNELRLLDNQAGNHEDVGPGNFQYLRLDCDTGGGGSCLRQKMAGSIDRCAANTDTVETEPGQTQGPVVQGFNTRFGEYSGGGLTAAEYPPDVVVTASNLDWEEGPPGEEDIILENGQQVRFGSDIENSYDDYVEQVNNHQFDYPPPSGAFERRIISLPVADCTGDETGQSTLEVEGYACYFLLQPLATGGGNVVRIFGQFVSDCLSSGSPDPNSTVNSGPFKIQLYKDPDSNDS